MGGGQPAARPVRRTTAPDLNGISVPKQPSRSGSQRATRGARPGCHHPGLDGHHPGVEVSPPASADQRPPYGRPWCAGDPARESAPAPTWQEPPARQAGRRGRKRPWVELPQRAAQCVHVPLAIPDQALVSPGLHLDRLDQRAVAGDLAVVVAVVRTRSSSTLASPVGLGPGGPMPAVVATHGMGVDRIDLIASGQQRIERQPVGRLTNRIVQP